MVQVKSINEVHNFPISLSILILFSGKTSKILGEVQKVVGIGAGGTIIYKIWFDKSKNSSRSSSSNDNKKEDDNKKDEVKKKKVNLMKINKKSLPTEKMTCIIGFSTLAIAVGYTAPRSTFSSPVIVWL